MAISGLVKISSTMALAILSCGDRLVAATALEVFIGVVLFVSLSSVLHIDDFLTRSSRKMLTSIAVRHRTKERLCRFQLGLEAQKHWRRLNGSALLHKVITGVQFIDGEELQEQAA
jgi:hypothetical protein